MQSLFDMAPRLASYNSGNRSLGNSESLGKTTNAHDVWNVRCSNLLNLVISVFAGWALFSYLAIKRVIFSAYKSFSFNSVLRIFSMTSQIQMVRSDARRVITFVKHPKLFIKWAISKYPRHAMRLPKFSSIGNFSISKFIFSRQPPPTFVSLANPLPKVNFIPLIGICDSDRNYSLIMFRSLSFIGVIHKFLAMVRRCK